MEFVNSVADFMGERIGPKLLDEVAIHKLTMNAPPRGQLRQLGPDCRANMSWRCVR